MVAERSRASGEQPGTGQYIFGKLRFFVIYTHSHNTSSFMKAVLMQTNIQQFHRSRPLQGSRNPRAILTAEDVLDIRQAPRQVRQKSIAETLKVSPSAVSRARAGKTWAHIPHAQLAYPGR